MSLNVCCCRAGCVHKHWNSLLWSVTSHIVGTITPYNAIDTHKKTWNALSSLYTDSLYSRQLKFIAKSRKYVHFSEKSQQKISSRTGCATMRT